MDEIRRNPERHGTGGVRSRLPKRSGRLGYGFTGAVEIAQRVVRELDVDGLVFAFTYGIAGSIVDLYWIPWNGLLGLKKLSSR